MFLYHATYKKNLESIKEKGLITGQRTNFEGMYINDCIYFAFNPEAAICFLESADTFDGDEIIVFKIDSKDINKENILYDWNNRCEYEDDIISIAYSGNINPEYLHLIDKKEIDNIEDIKFSELKHLDNDSSYIWEIIGTIFDEEVETKKDFEL